MESNTGGTPAANDSLRSWLATLETILTGGRWWQVKCLLAVFVAALLFSCDLALLWKVGLPPAYDLKSQDPLADTSTLTEPADNPGERSHGAKLTPRLVGSYLLHFARSASTHPYWPATIGGLLFLWSGILTGARLTGDRLSGLLLGLLYAGLYATSDCFAVCFAPKPFDGVALGLVGVTIACIGRPWAVAIFAFLGCWTDERALLALLLIAVLVWAMASLEKKQKILHFCALGVAPVLYVVSRMLIAQKLGWQSPNRELLGDFFHYAIPWAQITAWVCFEGGWLLIACAAWKLLKAQKPVPLVALLAGIAASIVATLLVVDGSRAASFTFPLLPAALAFLVMEGTEKADLRKTIAGAAIVSLLAPNLEVLVTVAINWLPSLPTMLITRTF